MTKLKATQQKNNFFEQIKTLLLFIFGIVNCISLLSYSPFDMSINVVSSNQRVDNFFGLFGAIYSDFVLQSFGFGAYFLTLFSFIYVYLRHIGVVDWLINKNYALYPLLTFGMICLSGFLGLFTHFDYTFDFFPGGAIGYVINNTLLKNTSPFISGGVLGVFSIFIFVICFIPRTVVPQEKNHDTTTPIFDNKLSVSMSGMFRRLSGFIKKKHLNVNNSHLLDVNATKIFKSRDIQKDDSIETKNTETYTTREVVTYKNPTFTHMKTGNLKVQSIDQININAGRLMQALQDFGITGKINGFHAGPVVTLYEFIPDAGIKISRVVALSDDIARTMKVPSTRIAIIRGKESIGIEVPNEARETVYLRNILESKSFASNTFKIPIVLGSTIVRSPGVTDLVSMPHLLIAGTTGSGKSIGLNAMIVSILIQLSFEKCRFLMIDPKMLELSVYNGIPHLVTPVITDPKKAVTGLKWATQEMEKRYKLMSEIGVKNIDSYNERIIIRGFPSELDFDCDVYNSDKTLPYVVVIIDEMADLMMTAGKEIEALIQRLSQMARAAGIHLIMATQRPSVDVITGIIKANMPTRVSYHVTSKIDSRTILGEQGAEALLGKGDMLYMSAGAKITRLHGAFISEEEIEGVVNQLKDNYSPNYIDIISKFEQENEEMDMGNEKMTDDDYYNQALKIVMTEKKCSISYIQRRLRIGYNKAANIIEQMERNGILTQPDSTGKRNLVE